MTTEKRLIDANALIAEYDWVHIGEAGKARKLMEDAPTVDAVEVVHGHWAIINENCCVCSACHKHSIQDYYYCPNCGAKMDLED